MVTQPVHQAQAQADGDGDDNDDDDDPNEDIHRLFIQNPNQPPANIEVLNDDSNINESGSNRGELDDHIDDYDDDDVFSNNDDAEYLSAQSSTDYGSINECPLTNDHNDAFLHDTEPLSVSSMSPTSRLSLERHFDSSSSLSNESASMTWDHSTDLLADLEIPRYEITEEEDSIVDEVFESSYRSSTPRRVTRSLTSSGEYEMSLSPIPFIRNSRLRRPYVRWQNNVPAILETGHADRRQRRQSRSSHQQ